MSKLERRQFLCVLAGSAAVAGAAAIWSRNRRTDALGLRAFQRTSWALGSDVSVTVFDTDAWHANAALNAVFVELELIEQLMSLYRPDSQLCRLNREQFLSQPHPCLLEVLTVAQQMSERTNGAFDVTVQPLWNLYAEAKQTGSLPSDDQVTAVRKLVDWRQVEFDTAAIRFKSSGMAITLNGIAQGFATDRARAVLRAHGIQNALIDAGELGAVGSAKPDGSDWTIGIQHPRLEDSYLSLAKLADRCLATSGDYATRFSEDFRHHHLFDPRTGRSPTDLSSVSIAATTAMEADALSTAVFVLGPEAGLRLVHETPGADALLVLKDGRTQTTSSFPLSS